MWNNLAGWHEFRGVYGGIFDRMGLISGGFLEFESPEDCGNPRLSFFAYKMLAQKTDAIHAERLGKVNETENKSYVSAYRNRQSGTVGWVAWSLSESVPPVIIKLPVESDSVRVVGFITDESGVPLRDEVIDVENGLVSIELGIDPVWIRETSL